MTDTHRITVASAGLWPMRRGLHTGCHIVGRHVEYRWQQWMLKRCTYLTHSILWAHKLILLQHLKLLLVVKFDAKVELQMLAMAVHAEGCFQNVACRSDLHSTIRLTGGAWGCMRKPENQELGCDFSISDIDVIEAFKQDLSSPAMPRGTVWESQSTKNPASPDIY